MGFLEKLFGKKKEKELTQSTEETFDIETATTFLKKKYNENFQLLNISGLKT